MVHQLGAFSQCALILLPQGSPREMVVLRLNGGFSFNGIPSSTGGYLPRQPLEFLSLVEYGTGCAFFAMQRGSGLSQSQLRSARGLGLERTSIRGKVNKVPFDTRLHSLLKAYGNDTPGPSCINFHRSVQWFEFVFSAKLRLCCGHVHGCVTTVIDQGVSL